MRSRQLCRFSAIAIVLAILVYSSFRSQLHTHNVMPILHDLNPSDGKTIHHREEELERTDGVPEVHNDGEKEQSKSGRSERELSILMQRRISYLQNPSDCNSTKKLVCSFTNRCGFGCLMHQVVLCFIMAYATERTLVMDRSIGWLYSSKGFETAFLPVSNCTIAEKLSSLKLLDERNTQSSETLVVPSITQRLPHLPQIPTAVPRDLFDQLKDPHSPPFGWFAGQFLKYAMRPNPGLEHYIQERKRKLALPQTLVGLQIRRRDKISEAKLYSLETYMSQVVERFNREAHHNSTVGRNVFIATDDLTVFNEAQKDYPQHNFIRNMDSAYDGAHYTVADLYGLVFEVLTLSECDFVVCTFTSNICRLVYELMLIRDLDAVYRIHSLDCPYHFLLDKAEVSVANESHTAASPQELSFAVGDGIGITGQWRDGWCLGVTWRGTNTFKGLFPSHKVKQHFKLADFPTYNGIS